MQGNACRWTSLYAVVTLIPIARAALRPELTVRVYLDTAAATSGRYLVTDGARGSGATAFPPPTGLRRIRYPAQRREPDPGARDRHHDPDRLAQQDRRVADHRVRSRSMGTVTATSRRRRLPSVDICAASTVAVVVRACRECGGESGIGRSVRRRSAIGSVRVRPCPDVAFPADRTGRTARATGRTISGHRR
jgi:hypothetical protein